MRRLFTASTAAVLLSVVAGIAWGDVQYTVTDTGITPYRSKMQAPWVGINNSGQLVGQSADQHAFLWDSGTGVQDLGAGNAAGINNAGQVVGQNGDGHAFLWDSGSGMQDLGAGAAIGINNAGQVVGQTGDGHACIWDSVSSVQDLGTLGGYSSLAYGINDSRQVVGAIVVRLGGAGSLTHAFCWDSDNGMQDLASGIAYSINNSQHFVGTSGLLNAALWQSSTDVQILGSGIAFGINDDGQVVGQVVLGKTDRCAALWDNGSAMQNLNDLIDPSSEWLLTAAAAISDNGQIACVGTNADGDEHVLLVTPLPEPSTLVLLVAGAVSLLSYAWRRPRTNV